MQALALQPALHVGERKDDRVDVAGSIRAQAVEGEEAVVGCAHRALVAGGCGRLSSQEPRSSAAVSSQCSSIDLAGAARRAAQDGGDDRGCWRSEWAMLASSTGIALSISCSVDWTDVTASTTRGEPVRAAMVRWKRESACRWAAGGRGGDRLVGRSRARRAAASSRSRARRGRPRRAPRSGGSRARRASRRAARTYAGRARADGRRRLSVTTVPPPRPRVVSTSPASAAPPSPRAGWPARRPAGRPARARAAASSRAGRRPAGSRWPAAPRTPRRRGARGPAAARPRPGGRSAGTRGCGAITRPVSDRGRTLSMV